MASRLGHERSSSRTERKGGKEKTKNAYGWNSRAVRRNEKLGEGGSSKLEFSAEAWEEVKAVGICGPEGAQRPVGTW